MNDIIVQFAMLWGMTIGSAISPKEIETAEKMKQYNSEELLQLMSEWAEEYVSANAEDTVEFFEKKLWEQTCSFEEYMK